MVGWMDGWMDGRAEGGMSAWTNASVVFRESGLG